MSSGFSIFSPNFLLQQLQSTQSNTVEDQLSALSSYHKPTADYLEKPRKRSRQRVDAGLPRNAYSKTNYPNTLSLITNPVSNPLRVNRNDKSDLNLIEQIHNRNQSENSNNNNMFGNFASSYFANPYLQTFIRLQQLKQSSVNGQYPFPYHPHQVGGGEMKIQELADPNDETENEYESSRKRKKSNFVDSFLSKIRNQEGKNEEGSETSGPSARSSPGVQKEMILASENADITEELDNHRVEHDEDQDCNDAESPHLYGLRSKSSSDKSTHLRSDTNQVSSSVVPKSSSSVHEPEVPSELKELAEKLKSELMQTLSETVDKIVNKYFEEESVIKPSISNGPHSDSTFGTSAMPGYTSLFLSPAQTPVYQSIFPTYNRPQPGSLSCLNVLANKNNNVQDGRLSLMFGRKRRTKVTDTRVSKSSTKHDADNVQSPMSSASFPYPTMVPQTQWTPEEREFSSISPEIFETEGMEMNGYDVTKYQSSTLTPMHLRKAKLIFFYARYPTSALLKAYFPDIRFHKNNTAQLVKWFSNFREYYYIQMEKYARQALAEGVKKAEDIHISADCELYRSLIQHYSRNNNYIQVPSNFRPVVESTLREFFTALQNGRDLESSWKKSIYKVIARMDEQIPEYFKTANFLEQLK